MMSFLKVEKYIKSDHVAILEKQKADVLAAGGQWVEPEEHLRREQQDAQIDA